MACVLGGSQNPKVLILTFLLMILLSSFNWLYLSFKEQNNLQVVKSTFKLSKYITQKFLFTFLKDFEVNFPGKCVGGSNAKSSFV